MRRRKRRQKGSGQVLERQPGRWSIRWWEKGKCHFRGSYATKEEAERTLAKVIGEIAQGRDGMPPDSRGFPTLSKLADEWLARRDHTHRAADDDRCRWNLHLKPAFGHLRAPEVDSARIRGFVEAMLSKEHKPAPLNPATVGHCVRLLSTFFSDLCERSRETGATANPVRTLPRSTRRLMKPTHRPEDTPFLESLTAVRQVFQALRDGNPEEDVPGHEQTAVAFAAAAFGGLRTGEVLGLSWQRVDLDGRRMRVVEQVHNSALGPLKDDESRTVPVQDALIPVLTAWKLKTGGEGLLFKPEQPGRRAGRGTGAPSTFVRPHTLHKHLRKALTDCKLPGLTWYQCTRHTFASQWVIAGGSMEKLAVVLGHSSTEVTRHYAHLRPDHLRAADRRLLDVDLLRAGGEVVPLPGADREAASGEGEAPGNGAIKHSLSTGEISDMQSSGNTVSSSRP